MWKLITLCIVIALCSISNAAPYRSGFVYYEQVEPNTPGKLAVDVYVLSTWAEFRHEKVGNLYSGVRDSKQRSFTLHYFVADRATRNAKPTTSLGSEFVQIKDSDKYDNTVTAATHNVHKLNYFKSKVHLEFDPVTRTNTLASGYYGVDVVLCCREVDRTFYLLEVSQAVLRAEFQLQDDYYNTGLLMPPMPIITFNDRVRSTTTDVQRSYRFYFGNTQPKYANGASTSADKTISVADVKQCLFSRHTCVGLADQQKCNDFTPGFETCEGAARYNIGGQRNLYFANTARVERLFHDDATVRALAAGNQAGIEVVADGASSIAIRWTGAKAAAGVPTDTTAAGANLNVPRMYSNQVALVTTTPAGVVGVQPIDFTAIFTTYSGTLKTVTNIFHTILDTAESQQTCTFGTNCPAADATNPINFQIQTGLTGAAADENLEVKFNNAATSNIFADKKNADADKQAKVATAPAALQNSGARTANLDLKTSALQAGSYGRVTTIPSIGYALYHVTSIKQGAVTRPAAVSATVLINAANIFQLPLPFRREARCQFVDFQNIYTPTVPTCVNCDDAKLAIVPANSNGFPFSITYQEVKNPTNQNPPFQTELKQTNVPAAGITRTGMKPSTVVQNYRLVVTDKAGCYTTRTVTVNPHAAGFTVTLTNANKVDAKCRQDGSATLTTTQGAGFAVESVTWQGQFNGIAGAVTTTGANALINNKLEFGTYVATVTWVNGAVRRTGKITFTINGPNTKVDLTATQTVTHRCTTGARPGAIINTVSGGVQPYKYSWKFNNAAENPLVTTKDRTNLAAGRYDVLITDAFNCAKTFTVTITDSNFNIVKLLTSQTRAPSCVGRADGIVGVNANAGVALTYEWQFPCTGSGKDCVSGFTPPANYGNCRILRNVPQGKYKITAVDSKGCKSNTEDLVVPNASLPTLLKKCEAPIRVNPVCVPNV